LSKNFIYLLLFYSTMKNLKVLFYVCCVFTFTFTYFSCSNDETLDHLSISNGQLESRSSDNRDDNLTETSTILGRQRNNPYTVANMTKAYNTIYKTNLTSLPVTHKYIKFIPTTLDHVELIQAWELAQRVAVFDFPLDYEITTMGDSYYDPAVSDSLLTYRYASVPVGVTMPNVPYLLISDVVIPPYNSFLTEMAFYQVQEQWEGNNSPHPVGPGTDGNGNPIEGPNPGTTGPYPGTNDSCTPACNNYPCCNVGWNDCDEYPCGTSLTPNCQPGSAEWPFCLEINPPFGPGTTEPRSTPEFCTCTQYFNNVATSTWRVQLLDGQDCDDLETQWGIGAYTVCNKVIPPPPPVTNDCGCPLPSNIRFPAGCVQVERNIGNFEPVQNVMIKVKDTWLSSNVTFTTNQGCWQVSAPFSGKMWMFVQFENNNCEVRAVRQHFQWKAAVVADDYVGSFNGPTFNNILVRYDAAANANNMGTLGRMYWACAHTINADNEYRTNAGGDGVPVPRTGLNYLLNDNDGSAGGAPMLQGHPFGSWPQLLTAFGNWVTIALTTSLTPDITAGYALGGTPLLPRTRDRYKQFLFHELGHASHHALVGEGYWFAYRNHIINNDIAGNGVYGSFNDFALGSDPDRIALGEALGNFTGNRYGGDPDGGENRNFNRPNDPEPENFIPRGLMFDLGDNMVDLVVDPNTGGTTGVPVISGIDNISGFTPAMIFGALHPNVNSIREFRDRLRTNSLSATPNTAGAFNTFVDVYDVFN
jgi:hypothetical protein